MCVRALWACCLRNTITFLLSDRVSRHTRDRARQCALETEQGHPNHPPHLQTESLLPPSRSLVDSLSSTLRHGNSVRDTRLDYLIFKDSATEIGYETRFSEVTRGSLSLFLKLSNATQLGGENHSLICSRGP